MPHGSDLLRLCKRKSPKRRAKLTPKQLARAKATLLDELWIVAVQNKRVFGYTAGGTAIQCFGPDKPVFDECWRLFRLAVKTVKEAT